MVKTNGKILLVQSPPWGIYAPPLGIAYLATFLKSFGFLSEVLDLNMEIFNGAAKDIKEKWDTQDFEFWASGKAVDKFKIQLEDLADRIVSFGASFIGFSTTFASVPFINAILPIVRNKSKNRPIVIVGGAGTNYQEIRSLFRKDLIDYFVVGEGEYALLYLLRDLQENKTPQTGSGYIIWKDKPQDNVICLRSSGDNSTDIDSIPFPTFEEFDLKAYTQQDLLPLISSRGCVRSCAFCCDAPLKKPYRCRGPEKVAEEIAHHVQKYSRDRKSVV